MSREHHSGGVGLCTVVLVVFIILKLTDNVAWSWFWVLSPLWIPASIIAVLLTIAGVVALIASITSSRRMNSNLDKALRDEAKGRGAGR